MVKVMHLYVDDSGTRNVNHKPGTRAAHGYDWFALGGVLIRQEDEAAARQLHIEFMARWGLDPDVVYLHSFDIRNKTGDFTWLSALPEAEFTRFMNELYELMRAPPYVGFACVIDRPGYEHRYRARYGRDQWSLCKTAFSVLAERAAKYASNHNCKLKIFVERSDSIVDGWIRGYYEYLREHGMPFAVENMQQYQPLTAAELKSTLYEFRTKSKSSPLMQLADLYLWPMAIGGYHRSNRTYARLHADGKLIDCHLTPKETPTLGIKYSCWDLVKVEP
jgi:hypothetical protein